MKTCIVIGLRNLITENKAIPQIQILLGGSTGALEAHHILVNEPAPLKSSLASAVRKYLSF